MAYDCVYIGDSIAVEIQAYDNACILRARKGLSVPSILKEYGGVTGTDITIMSMGSNQPDIKENVHDMLEIRRSVRSRVVWILPYDRGIAAKVSYIARGLGDLTIDLAPFPSNDGVHPTLQSARAISDLIGYIKIEYKRMALNPL